MASIFERKIKKQVAYYLREKVDGKVKLTYLGTKPPFPKSRGWTSLSAETIERLKRKAKQRAGKPVPATTLPGGKFQVIYADPPWQYDFSKVEAWGIETHYETLPLDDIKHYRDGNGVSIQEIIAQDAVLFLWAPPPKLKEALEVMEAWGFEYKTSSVWVKDRLGLGYWWMQKAEYLLLGKRGNFPAPATKRRPVSVFEAPWRGHSRKPGLVYRMIERMCCLPPAYKNSAEDYYLECFARGIKRPHWAAFGKEYHG
jgi:N6-adenosine-specific RNA methylase IME4